LNPGPFLRMVNRPANSRNWPWEDKMDVLYVAIVLAAAGLLAGLVKAFQKF